MKWDWKLLGAVALSHLSVATQVAASFLEKAAQMVDDDHEWRLDRKEMEMSVSLAIESLPGGENDNNWGGTHEDDKGGGK